jgi:hypothetical protein
MQHGRKISIPKIMSPNERQYITDQAAAKAAQTVGQRAEMAAQIATSSLWRQQIGKAKTVALVAFGVALILGGGVWIGSARGGKARTPRPQDRATAKCVDGTWSYSLTRQGACAAHGGVKTFYK